MQMRRIVLASIMVAVFMVAPAPVTQHAGSNSYTIEQIKGYPFPNELTTSATGSRIAWAFNERGARNVWVAEGPDFKARRLTNYETDDGQELTSLSISADGKYVVYVRGGDHGSNFDSSVGVNPAIGADADEGPDLERAVRWWRAEAVSRRRRAADFAEERSPRLRKGSRPVDRTTRWLGTSQTTLLRTRRLRRARVVARRLEARVRFKPRRPFLRRHLHKRVDTHRLSRAVNFARLEPALVT